MSYFYLFIFSPMVNFHVNCFLCVKNYMDFLSNECCDLVLLHILCALFSFILVGSKIIELSGIELQKLRINLQKVQQQNLLLAQANSQMLAVPFLLLSDYIFLSYT